MKMETRFLELINATLGLSLLLIILILARDFKNEFLAKEPKIKISLALLGLGILVFSVKELLKYGTFDHTILELLETLFLLLTLGAFFSLLRIKKLTLLKIQ